MTGELFIFGGTVLTPRQRFQGGVEIRNGRIARLFAGAPPKEAPAAVCIDACGGWIIPGLIDIHLHGGVAVDFNSAGLEAVECALHHHASNGGTTALLPTLLTDSPERLKAAVEVIRRARRELPGPEILGIHLEGPFLNPVYRGAHPERYLLSPLPPLVQELCAVAGEDLAMVTLAPELPGALAAISYLRQRGVTVALGHSGASYEQVREAVAAGLSHAVHAFSAMSGFHHRAPGAAGAILDLDAVTAELIADGVHTHPAAARLLFRCKGENGVVLVTDASPVAGLLEGKHRLGGQDVFVSDGVSRLADGTLAGSTLTMNRAVAVAMAMASLSLEEAIIAATLNPARVLGLLPRKGSLSAGSDADVVVLDSSLNVRLTVCRGRVFYNGL